jgi:DNA-binding response OmpR family regulator
MTEKPNIFLLEDDKDIGAMLVRELSYEGFQTTWLAEGSEVSRALGSATYELLILDIMVPGRSGLEICKGLRAEGNQTPVIFLTARGTEMDKVLGLELGADDYLTKPFSMRELMARIRALLRRRAQTAITQVDPQPAPEQIVCKNLTIDPVRRVVHRDGSPIELTAKEFDLLYFLAANRGRPFTREALLDRVWHYDCEGYEHTVSSHINRLRKKIEPDPDQPVFVLTVWSVGYKFVE